MSEIPKSVTEVKLRGGLIREKALGTVGLKAAEPTEPTMALRGTTIREQGIKERLAYLESIQKLAEKLGWGRLLSGENPEVSSGGVRLDEKAIIRSAGAELDKSVISFAAVKTGVDYKDLRSKYPTKRFKFYHSFKDKQLGEDYMTEVVRQAIKQGLSLELKSFDHDYDGMNVYTHHHQQMEAIIREIYPRYEVAFYDAEHFLQGGIDGVNPRHIGWAQEPIAAAGQRSHSGRMGIIGESIDVNGLNPEAYLGGCKGAGVRPDRPWLLTDDYERQLQQRVAEIAKG